MQTLTIQVSWLINWFGSLIKISKNPIFISVIRKSVEARDWLSTVEPRAVRAVMKRVVEDVSLIDEQVGQLYQEGQRKLRSSDSSRTFGNRSRSVFSNYTNSTHLDSSLASNIQKLFSEKIDYFAPVTNNKVIHYFSNKHFLCLKRKNIQL